MDAWQTYPFEFKGGLITNLSPLQHGTQAPGSARILRNFEPSVQGGYRRVLGYIKFDSSYVPYCGAAVVQGAGQTGTTLVLAAVSSAPAIGATVTVGANTYTISNVSYVSGTQTCTLTLSTSLVSSPADKLAVSFSNNTSSFPINGITAWDGTVVITRGNDVYKTTGTGITQINVPSYGTVLVNGGSQTGTSLIVDGLTAVPQIGDTFTIGSVAKTYIVTALPTVTAGGATLTISPALASSPADNAAITFTSTSFAAGTHTRSTRYRLGNTEKIAAVNGVSYPFTYDNTTFTKLTSNTDLLGAAHVCWFKNSLFFAKGDAVYFTAPFTDDDLLPANGAGVINVGGRITALKVFREQLIIFCEQSIKRVTGTSFADYTLQPITENIGCVASDSVQEIGGDIMFLAPDGLRLLSATDRIGDFNLGSVSKPIQTELTTLIGNSTDFSSVVIRAKSQYRLFGYRSGIANSAAKGILGTQLEEGGIAWAETAGFSASVADSDYSDQEELVVFANADGYVYQMEKGNSLDGGNIRATFATPYVPINDPRIRKTFYKLLIYVNPEGAIELSTNLKLDFDDKGSVQPDTIELSNIAGIVNFFGNSDARYGAITFGEKLKKLFETQTIGSGFSVSLSFICDDTNPPFSFDAATLEYATHDRR